MCVFVAQIINAINEEDLLRIKNIIAYNNYPVSNENVFRMDKIC